MRSPRGYYPQVALAELVEIEDGGKQQTVTHHGLAGEKHSGVYRPQYFGFSSHPPKGATGVVVSAGGERSRSVFLGGEHDDHRPTGLKEGEAKLYDAEGNIIFLGRKNGTKIKTAKGDTVIETDDGKFTMTSKGDKTFESKDGKVTMKAGGDVVIETKGKILLGGAGATARVGTEAGFSNKVFAVI
jgi:phage baseplate assembly protein V